MTLIKKEIEIDLPDGLERYIDPNAFAVDEWKFTAPRHWEIRGRLIVAPKREPLVTRIARAVLRKECGFTPAMRYIQVSKGWSVYSIHNAYMGKDGRVTGPIPPHEPGDPETVLVADINAEVERLREGVRYDQ